MANADARGKKPAPVVDPPGTAADSPPRAQQLPRTTRVRLSDAKVRELIERHREALERLAKR